MKYSAPSAQLRSSQVTAGALRRCSSTSVASCGNRTSAAGQRQLYRAHFFWYSHWGAAGHNRSAMVPRRAAPGTTSMCSLLGLRNQTDRLNGTVGHLKRQFAKSACFSFAPVGFKRCCFCTLDAGIFASLKLGLFLPSHCSVHITQCLKLHQYRVTIGCISNAAGCSMKTIKWHTARANSYHATASRCSCG